MTKEISSYYAIILNVDDGTFTELTSLNPYEVMAASPDLSVILEGSYTWDGLLYNFYTRGGDLLLSTKPEGEARFQSISSNNKYAVFIHEGSFDFATFSVIEIATGKITYAQAEAPDPSSPPSMASERYLGDWFPTVGENQFWTAFKNTQETI